MQTLRGKQEGGESSAARRGLHPRWGGGWRGETSSPLLEGLGLEPHSDNDIQKSNSEVSNNNGAAVNLRSWTGTRRSLRRYAPQQMYSRNLPLKPLINDRLGGIFTQNLEKRVWVEFGRPDLISCPLFHRLMRHPSSGTR